MAFIVENGTGVKGANSYAAVAGFDAYFGDRAEDISALSSTQKEQRLVAATDYIDTRWGLRLLGIRRWRDGLNSRSIFSLTGQPVVDEIVVVGSVTYTFKVLAALPDEVTIGISLLKTLGSLASAIAESGNDDFIGSELADPDVVALTLFTTQDGIVTTTDVANGSMSSATTSGLSNKRQSLEFPRDSLKDGSGKSVFGIPELLAKATYEYAFRASTALAPDPTTHASGQRQTVDRTQVGPIVTHVEFQGDSTPQITKPYPLADRMLREYVTPAGVMRA